MLSDDYSGIKNVLDYLNILKQEVLWTFGYRNDIKINVNINDIINV